MTENSASAATGAAATGTAPRVEHLGQGATIGQHRLRIDGVVITADPSVSAVVTAPDGRTVRVFNDEGNYVGAQEWGAATTDSTPTASPASLDSSPMQKLGTTSISADPLATAKLDGGEGDPNRDRATNR